MHDFDKTAQTVSGRKSNKIHEAMVMEVLHYSCQEISRKRKRKRKRKRYCEHHALLGSNLNETYKEKEYDFAYLSRVGIKLKY